MERGDLSWYCVEQVWYILHGFFLCLKATLCGADGFYFSVFLDNVTQYHRTFPCFAPLVDGAGAVWTAASGTFLLGGDLLLAAAGAEDGSCRNVSLAFDALHSFLLAF